MPADITGTDVIEEEPGDRAAASSSSCQGPLFANMVLADEINRTPPQDAGRAARSDAGTAGHRRRHAAQARRPVLRAGHAEPDRTGRHLPAARSAAGPLHVQGVREVPELQGRVRDRPPHDRRRRPTRSPRCSPASRSSRSRSSSARCRSPITSSTTAWRSCGRRASASRACRSSSSEWLSWGAGPRAVQNLILGGKARALLYGRSHVTTEDIKALALPGAAAPHPDELHRRLRRRDHRHRRQEAARRDAGEGRRSDRRRAVQEDLRVLMRVPSSRFQAVGTPGSSLGRSQPGTWNLEPGTHAMAQTQRRRPAAVPRPEDDRPHLAARPAGPAGRRRVPHRHAQEPRLRAVASSSSSTASTCPATTSAASTGRSGQRSDKFVHQAVRGGNQPAVVRRGGRQRVDAVRGRQAPQAGTLYKYDYAATAAACLAYLTIKQQDSCGLITFDEDVRQVDPAAQFAAAHGRGHQGAARQQAAGEDRPAQDHAAGRREHAQPRPGR